MNKPNGPIKYVINRGKIINILLIENFCESLTIHQPVKRLIQITWAYYGDRCSAYLFGESSIIYYRILYILAFFIAGSGFIDTEIIWNFALITVAASTLPNLISIFLLRNEMKSLIKTYNNRAND